MPRLQIPGGLMADRIVPRILYAVCLITWSLATIAQGFANGFASLFAFRLATGAFEAPSYPINNRIVTSWFPDHERASAIALFVSGQFIGLAFLTPVLVALQFYAGWRGLFIVTGAVGLVWGIVWYILYRDPLDSKRVKQAELDYIEKGGGVLKKKDGTTDFLPGDGRIGSRSLPTEHYGEFTLRSFVSMRRFGFFSPGFQPTCSISRIKFLKKRISCIDTFFVGLRRFALIRISFRSFNQKRKICEHGPKDTHYYRPSFIRQYRWRKLC